MTPPDGRDVAEAAVDEAKLGEARARLARAAESSDAKGLIDAYVFVADLNLLLSAPPAGQRAGVELADACATLARLAELYVRVDEPKLAATIRLVVAALHPIPAVTGDAPTPATAGEPSTAEEVLGEGPAFWLNVKREPAGEPSPSLREAYARIIAPDAFRHFDAPGFPQMHPMRRGPVLDSVALARNKADAILALRTAPASSVEGGKLREALKTCRDVIVNASVYFPEGSMGKADCDLGIEVADAALAPHQPEEK